MTPRKPLDQLWQWAEDEIAPDVIAMTEAEVPKGGFPRGWSARWGPDGIEQRRRWGTVMAGRGVYLRPGTEVRCRFRSVPLHR